MPEGARHGKNHAKLGTARLWHQAQGVPPFQRNRVGTEILKSELRHHREDRWLRAGSNDFFVPAKDLCQKRFAFLFLLLLNPLHLGFSLLFPIPADCS